MKLGSNDIGSVYIGSTAVNKIYIGSTEVWTSNSGLLADYPGAAAAYSLRLLQTTYTGDAIRVRRASDNAESDIGFIDGQLDTSTLETFCSGTNGYVTTWYDQSGNGNDATQTTAASQPQIVSSGSTILQNGKPALNFGYSSTTHWLDVTINWSITNLTTFSVAYRSTTTLFNYKFGRLISISKSPDYDYQNNDGYLVALTNQTFSGFNPSALVLDKNALGISYTLGTRVLITTRRNTSNEFIQSNNGSISSAASSLTTKTPTLLRIGTNRQNTDSALQGTIQENIIYLSDQSGNQSQINTNINSQYQIYWDGSQTSLLDTYGGSAAAYSLRALSSSYTGALIKVRRASDNAEQDIYAKYDGSLNTDALESFCSGTNGFVTTWYDQSGNGNDATQTTAASQPQIVSSGSTILDNGKPSLNFNSSKEFNTPSFLSNLPLDNFSFYQVLETPLNGKTAAAISFQGADDLDFYPNQQINGDRIFWRNIGSANGNILPNSKQQYLYSFHYNKNGSNNNYTLHQNGVISLSLSSVALSNGFGNLYIGSVGGRIYLNTKMQELIFYPSDQSSNRTSIENNINAHYNIY